LVKNPELHITWKLCENVAYYESQKMAKSRIFDKIFDEIYIFQFLAAKSFGA